MQDNRVSNIDVARVIKKLVGVPPWMRRSTQGTLYGRARDQCGQRVASGRNSRYGQVASIGGRPNSPTKEALLLPEQVSFAL